MNPRGRQYALAGTLEGWTRLGSATPRQVRALRRAYAGRNPLTLSRHGINQVRAVLPSTTVIVKDPYAALSLPAVHAATGARAVLVFRHPGACLASYRRVGWKPDLDELGRAVAPHLQLVADVAPALAEWPDQVDLTEAQAVAVYWAGLNAVALADIRSGSVPGSVIVAHEELATGGAPAAHGLLEALDLRPGPGTDELFAVDHQGAPDVDQDRLHNLDRDPARVAAAWRATIDDATLEEMATWARPVHDKLVQARLELASTPDW